MINNFLILALFAFVVVGFFWLLKRQDDRADKLDFKFNKIAEAHNIRAEKVNTLYDELDRVKQTQLDEIGHFNKINSELSRDVRQIYEALINLKARPEPEARDWQVVIGGEAHEIKALTASQFIMHLERLPDFLFSFLSDPKPSKNKAGDLDKMVEYCKELLQASLVTPTDLERLNVPEAQDALRIIVKANGIDKSLASVFEKKALAGSSLSTMPPADTNADQAN